MMMIIKIIIRVLARPAVFLRGKASRTDAKVNIDRIAFPRANSLISTACPLAAPATPIKPSLKDVFLCRSPLISPHAEPVALKRSSALLAHSSSNVRGAQLGEPPGSPCGLARTLRITTIERREIGHTARSSHPRLQGSAGQEGAERAEPQELRNRYFTSYVLHGSRKLT